MIYTNCKQCNREFGYYSGSKSGEFCSMVCYSSSKKRPSKPCVVCKKLFYKKQHTTKFCSRVCMGLSFSQKFSRENHSKWNGGKFRDSEGYIHIKSYDHPYRDKENYVREHRLVMEKVLGRYLKPKEVVHHINEIVDDNRPENLEVLKSGGIHSAIHKTGKPLPKKNYKGRWYGKISS